MHLNQLVFAPALRRVGWSLVLVLLCSFASADESSLMVDGNAQSVPLTHVVPSLLPEGVLLGDFSKLDAAKKPSENFDLSDWSLTLPTDLNKDNKADIVYEKPLSAGFELKPLFYTADDGGMVFACQNVGATSSNNTKYARTELREMLRRGKSTIKTQGITANNWVLSSAHGALRRDAGAVDGSLEATLAVNRVSTTGDEKKVGRVIIGQIHATDDEPVRLYYRKLPNNSKGSVYFAHEINGGDDIWVNLVGSSSHTLADPQEGIALNEKFSYKITVENDRLTVTLIRAGKTNISQSLDISKSGYNKANQYLYFKAGVYNQNNSGDPKDYVQATFYYLANQH
jgi:hypothetical protein